MKPWAILTLAAAMSCATYESGQDIRFEDVQKIKVGETRKVELTAIFGPPYMTFDVGASLAASGASGDFAVQMMWTHTQSAAAVVPVTGLYSHSASRVSVEKLTVYVDRASGLVTTWAFEGEVNGAWQALGPGDVPLTVEEVAALRGSQD